MSSKAYLTSFVKEIPECPLFYILDTETTGLNQCEIAQMGLITSKGEVLIDTLVKPTKPIPADATNIHGITDEMVSNSPSWAEISPKVAEIIKDKLVVIYNSNFDVLAMTSSDKHVGIDMGYPTLANYRCAMNAFAVHYGDWSNYHHSYKWKPLSAAAHSLHVPVQDAHSALGDCVMALGVVNALLGYYSKAQS